VYKTKNEDKHPFFITSLVHKVACVSVLSISDCNKEWMLVFVLCLVHNVACVSVLSISDCNEEWMLVFVLCVYKTQNEDKHSFFITITNRQYRDTCNIVYKTQNEDKHPFFITITNRQYRDLYCLLVIVMKNGCLFSFCVLYTMLPVSVLSISDCNEEWMTNRQYRDTCNIVYKTQNEDKHPFFITITYRQYRDTGNIVYKTQIELIVMKNGCLSSFCVLYTMLPVSLYCL
jgi:hypothetical protein